jgi:hypothetical protein
VAFVGCAFLGAFGVAETILGCRLEGKLRTNALPILAIVVGVVGVTVVGAPFVAVRYFLPIQPALAAMVCARSGVSPWAVRATVGASLIVSTFLLVADHRWAAGYRAAADRMAERYGDRVVQFAGHWGWQFYMENRGFTAWDARRLPPAGAVLAIPERADSVPLHPAVRARLTQLETQEFRPDFLGITVWELDPRGDFGVRFYGGGFPHLAWGFSAMPERIAVYEVGP